MTAVRLKDIALAAGVDIGTVSHVLNRRPKSFLLRAETRERIERIASELGYYRNELAASISSSHGSKVLAFVTGEMGSIEYTGRIQNGVFTGLPLGYAVTLHHLAGDNETGIGEDFRLAGGWGDFHMGGIESVQAICQKLSARRIPYGL